MNRRDFSVRLTAILPGLAGARSSGFQVSEISRSAEAIHQDVAFTTTRARVYAALTITAQFDKVVHLSAAMQSGIPPDAPRTMISRVEGGAFSAFGGHIIGRHIELVPNRRIVQAWRVSDWHPGVFSVARFELIDAGTGCQLSFDHTGFPEGQAQRLAEGWQGNYWEPLQKYLASN